MLLYQFEADRDRCHFRSRLRNHQKLTVLHYLLVHYGADLCVASLAVGIIVDEKLSTVLGLQQNVGHVQLLVFIELFEFFLQPEHKLGFEDGLLDRYTTGLAQENQLVGQLAIPLVVVFQAHDGVLGHNFEQLSGVLVILGAEPELRECHVVCLVCSAASTDHSFSTSFIRIEGDQHYASVGFEDLLGNPENTTRFYIEL